MYRKRSALAALGAAAMLVACGRSGPVGPGGSAGTLQAPSAERQATRYGVLNEITACPETCTAATGNGTFGNGRNIFFFQVVDSSVADTGQVDFFLSGIEYVSAGNPSVAITATTITINGILVDLNAIPFGTFSIFIDRTNVANRLITINGTPYTDVDVTPVVLDGVCTFGARPE